ncbi:MAG: hypothetical protein KDE46_05750, partial [Caldilineaceae bacterium]|nr:hypothetical protein [Caldilineaceae bacterium]
MEQRITRISRTYVLPQATADAVKSLATATGTNVSQVVETLLDRALLEVESGRWTVEAIPTRFTMRLVDSSRTDNKQTTFRQPG